MIHGGPRNGAKKRGFLVYAYIVRYEEIYARCSPSPGPGGEGLDTGELPAKLSHKMELLSPYLQQNRDVVSRNSD